jgi:hypothetical protein
VLNQDPVIISNAEIAIGTTDSKVPAPINLGNVPLSVIVTDSSSNTYLARAQGKQIIVTALNKDGTRAENPVTHLEAPLFVVTCNGSGFNYLAVEPPSGAKGWSVAASTLTSPLSTSPSLSNTCTKKFAVSDIPASAAPIPSPSPYASNQTNTVNNADPGMLFLLKYSVGSNSSTLGVTTTSGSTLLFSGTTSASSGTTFTQPSSMSSLFAPATTPPAVYQYPGGGGTGYSIKRTSVKEDGSTLAQSVKLSGSGGAVVNRLIVSSLSSTGRISSANAGFRTFTVAGTNAITGLGTGNDTLCGPSPGYSGEFYDQLYLGSQLDKMILIFKDDTNKIGRVYLLNGVMGNGTASCSEIGTVNYPDSSRVVTTQNRLIYDNNRDLIYGAIGSITGDQLFAYDLIRGTFILSPVPSAAGKIGELLNPANSTSSSLYIIPPASGTTPLYKVW